jgi:hypothetical protein
LNLHLSEEFWTHGLGETMKPQKVMLEANSFLEPLPGATLFLGMSHICLRICGHRRGVPSTFRLHQSHGSKWQNRLFGWRHQKSCLDGVMAPRVPVDVQRSVSTACGPTGAG